MYKSLQDGVTHSVWGIRRYIFQEILVSPDRWEKVVRPDGHSTQKIGSYQKFDFTETQCIQIEALR